MNDVRRLLESFESGKLLRPSGVEPSTVDLALAIASACGANARLTLPASNIAEQIAAEHIVFVLVDGLGMNLIEAQPADAFLRSHTKRELRAVFPSTTATALTSLATGLWPAQHAIPGWWTYLPDFALTATILPFVERFTEKRLQDLGVDPAGVYLSPALAGSFTRDVCSFFPEQIAGSAYTMYSTGNTRALGYAELTAAIDATVQRVRNASGATYTYVYFPVVDALEHAVGPDASQVRKAVDALDGQMERLAAGLAGRARLVISADHGLTTVEDSGKHLVPPDLQELLLVPPSGEPRVSYFHAKPGSQDEFTARFRERFGAQFALLTIDEADELRLFGPPALTPIAQARIGDFVGVALGRDVLLSTEMEFRGFHGALTLDEMRIPLVVA